MGNQNAIPEKGKEKRKSNCNQYFNQNRPLNVKRTPELCVITINNTPGRQAQVLSWVSSDVTNHTRLRIELNYSPGFPAGGVCADTVIYSHMRLAFCFDLRLPPHSADIHKAAETKSL